MGEASPDYVPFSWPEAENSLRTLSKKVIDSGFKPDIIVGINRGGLIPARLISDFLHVHNIQVLTISFYTGVGKRKEKPEILQPLSSDFTGKNILLADDISDTGESFKVAKEHILSLNPAALKTLSIHMKETSGFTPDFFLHTCTKWIVYPWEKEEFFKDTGIKVD